MGRVKGERKRKERGRKEGKKKGEGEKERKGKIPVHRLCEVQFLVELS